MSFQSLPPELLDAVSSHLFPADLSSLSQVCAYVSPVAQRLLYRHVSLSPAFHNLGVVITLAKKPAIARFVRSFSINLYSNTPLFRAFYRHLALALESMTALTHLTLLIDSQASWVLPGAHARTFPRLIHFACSFSFDSHVVNFLEKTDALLELEVDSMSPRSLITPALPVTFIPKLAHFAGSTHAAQAVVPGRPVESIHLSSGDLTESVVNSFAQSTATVTVLGASTSSLPLPLLQLFSKSIPHLVYLRMTTSYNFTEAPDVVSPHYFRQRLGYSPLLGALAVVLRKRRTSIGSTA